MTMNANNTYREVLDFSVSPYALYHADCLEKMKEIPDKAIDMILCDLPYGKPSIGINRSEDVNSANRDTSSRVKKLYLS